ncbi:hypothetical protein [Halpernia sp. GG3]
MIKINSDSNKIYSQKFHFIDKKSWETEQKNYPKNTSHFFNGKKKEVFIISNEDDTIYLIGLGEISADVHYQDIGNNFAQSQKKNIQPISTEIIFENLDLNKISELVKGLFLGTYNYPFKGEHSFWQDEFSLSIKGLSAEEIQKITLDTDSICKGQFACMDWLNKPAEL